MDFNDSANLLVFCSGKDISMYVYLARSIVDIDLLTIIEDNQEQTVLLARNQTKFKVVREDDVYKLKGYGDNIR
ncbi:hypothetical protein DW1_1222 [Proteiniborus sp. DW1]|uniref:hypothetical protein n=1 Tax=Proteiniborus sp. DW1 TaxID=1889883 RepID=UPI00092E1902|nr:hypothetical protein [Proteiniborus sp. DW1]SCG82795.1 hypothetical protein DW1_1222 [Proteiniborus sp. DW1]